MAKKYLTAESSYVLRAKIQALYAKKPALPTCCRTYIQDNPLDGEDSEELGVYFFRKSSVLGWVTGEGFQLDIATLGDPFPFENPCIKR
jgi:hypothetical protein